jgi:hypothetical protein
LGRVWKEVVVAKYRSYPFRQIKKPQREQPVSRARFEVSTPRKQTENVTGVAGPSECRKRFSVSGEIAESGRKLCEHLL